MHHTLFEEQCSVFIGVNAILQFVGDVILEAMGLIPPRINHLSLTFINAFISYKTLSAIHKDKFRFLHEDCQIFWLLEILLIVGDVYYAFKDDWGREFIYVRLFFVCCSTFNWCFVTYIIIKYKLYHVTYQGHTDDENKSFIHEGDNNSDKEDPENPSPDVQEAMDMQRQISVAQEVQTKGDKVDDKNLADYHPEPEPEEPQSVEEGSIAMTHSEVP